MKKNILLIILLCSGICHAQQQSKWDVALDRYELICERCLELKRSQNSGIIPEKESISSLRTQLTMLRNNLLEVQGQMSKAQKARFDMIRQRFESEFITMPTERRKTASRRTAERIEKKRQNSDPSMAPDSTSRIVRTSIDPLPDIYTNELATTVIDSSTPTESIALTPRPEFSVQKRKTKYMVGLQGTIYPLKSFGLMVGTMTEVKGKIRLGGYVKCLSDFKFKGITPAYFCNSNGTSPDGRKIWTYGETTTSRFSAAAGVLMSFGRYCGCNFGIGYGSSQYHIKDISGNWAQITDISASGLAAEIGAIFFMGKYLWAGIGLSTTAFRYFEPQIAFGFSF